MRKHCELSTSHRRKVPSSLPLSRLRLLGVKARPYTSAVCPCSTDRDLPSTISQSRIVVSRLPLASVRPSGLQTTRFIPSVCLDSVRRKRPPATAHSLTVPSLLPLASRLPSGAKASPITQSVCPAKAWMQVVGSALCCSHTRMTPEKSPLANSRPFGLQAIAETGPGCESVSRSV